ncbi:hypothetical protein CLU93_0850 [Janthinobacterium sp. 35]|uniref:hypothetical protein n=1 Tax=unclassified Janthinobacterium TaxID=2610881 RepID=UPI000C18B69A|nr:MULTISPECIES: hypothetical protein [unclassified Janthinobacterium]PIG26638.1 hypothetical protein CLU93_0850 [Janthinobacterium sp. 35]PVX35291.1 hypothetical protein C8C92_1874 [Janthinobacterium sp. 78]
MDPISRATVPNVIPATPRVGATAPLAPALPVPSSSAAAALAALSSTQVDLSPLGQFLSGVALSRRQLLALQGVAEQAGTANTPVNVNDDLLALARQLTESFAQLQTSGIDASQLATAGDTPGSLAQRYDLLSGDGTTDAAAALAQDGGLLTQAQLARIGIDLRNEDVDAATLQAAYAADSSATLDALQQGTDVLVQVGAVLVRQQGAPLAAVVEADLAGAALPSSAVQAAQPQAVDAAPPQTAAIAQRQLELQQQLETEELNQDLQELRPPSPAAVTIDEPDLLQAQRADSLRVDARRIDSERMNTDQQAQQEEAAGAIRAASDRAQSLAGEAQVQADAGLATAQAQLAQQNAQAQALAAQNAGMAVPPPSSQDPSVAAAIAAYNLNNAALNPGLMNRPLPASDSRLPLVAPVAAVEPVKPVTKI